MKYGELRFEGSVPEGALFLIGEGMEVVLMPADEPDWVRSMRRDRVEEGHIPLTK
jgi:hypothetical protein